VKLESQDSGFDGAAAIVAAGEFARCGTVTDCRRRQEFP